MNKSTVTFLLIVLACLLAYSNTFGVPFHFDDNLNIVDNPVVKSLHYFADPDQAEGLKSRYALRSRYIGYLTFALNYALFGLNVAGYHVVNLLIHILNAFLIYRLVLLTFQTPYFSAGAHPPREREGVIIALFSALLFASHPVQTQAVTYIVQRFASLATLFYLLSLVMYSKWRVAFPRTGKPGLSALRYLISVLCAVLAMKTKEIAFTLPLMIALYEVLFFEGPARKRVLWLIPFFFTMLIIPLALFSADKPLGIMISDMDEASSSATVSRWDYLFTQFRVIVTYLRIIIFPINQNLDYDYPVYHSLLQGEVAASSLLILSLFASGIYFWYRSRLTPSVFRLASFGIFWFFITLSVESSVIPIQDVIFEHRLYLPLFGPAVLATTATFAIANRWKDKWPIIEKALVLLLALATVVFTGAAYARNRVWQNEITLWSDVVKKSPGKPRGYNGLGLAYANAGQLDTALDLFDNAISLHKTLQKSRDEAYGVVVNKGLVYFTKKDSDRAITEYNKAVLFAPELAPAYNNRGIVYYYQKQYGKAMEDFNKAIAMDPNYADAYHNRGIFFSDKGQIDNAIQDFDRAIRINPGKPVFHGRRGAEYVKNRAYDKAIADLTYALSRDRDRSDFYFSRGMAYEGAGELEKALHDYTTCLRLNPKYAKGHINRGIVYGKQGLFEKALEDFNKAVSLEPKDGGGYTNRAYLYYLQGRYEAALTDYRTSCSLGDKKGCDAMRELLKKHRLKGGG